MDNFPNTIQLGDVTKIEAKNLSKIDLLIGGSPCQDFSAANKNRLGLEGKKSNLFWEWARLLKEVKPTYFLLENVGSMDSNEACIISKELGVSPVQINSSLVSAQLRDRLYWTNIPGNGSNLFGKIIEQPINKNITFQDILTSGFTERKKARAVLESDGRPLKNPTRMLHRYIETGMTTLVFENKTIMENITNKRSGWKTNHDVEIKEGDIRYCNQLELERLQTLPEGYTKILSRNKAAGCIGDGWTVDVIVHLFNGLSP